MMAAKKSKRICIYSFLVIISIITIFPLFWMLSRAFMESMQIFTIPVEFLPDPFVIENFINALKRFPILLYVKNTMVIEFGVISGAVVISCMAAYSFARLRWRGRDFFFGLLLTSMMIPYMVTLIPTYKTWSLIGALDSYLPFIVPAWLGTGGLSGAFSIFLLRQFFMNIPKELDEAALTDGLNYFSIIWRIIVPNSLPAIFTVVLFAFLNVWNDLLGPVIYLTKDKLFTLSIGLTTFKNSEGRGIMWEQVMAACSLTVMPLLILYIFGQKFFIEGVYVTGIKG